MSTVLKAKTLGHSIGGTPQKHICSVLSNKIWNSEEKRHISTGNMRKYIIKNVLEISFGFSKQIVIGMSFNAMNQVQVMCILFITMMPNEQSEPQCVF